MPKKIAKKCGTAVELRCIEENDAYSCQIYDITGKPCDSGTFKIKRK